MGLFPRSFTLSLTANGMLDPKPGSPWPVDENYWLGHCEGFRVVGPGGRVGVVERVVYRSRVDRPDAVAVSCGVWRVHTAEVPVADVVEVLPAQERLVVRNGFAGAEQTSRWARARHALRGVADSSGGGRS